MNVVATVLVDPFAEDVCFLERDTQGAPYWVLRDYPKALEVRALDGLVWPLEAGDEPIFDEVKEVLLRRHTVGFAGPHGKWVLVYYAPRDELRFRLALRAFSTAMALFQWIHDEVPIQAVCTDCLAATGGQCRAHQEPECTCYEASPGHMPGCGFYRG